MTTLFRIELIRLDIQLIEIIIIRKRCVFKGKVRVCVGGNVEVDTMCIVYYFKKVSIPYMSHVQYLCFHRNELFV